MPSPTRAETATWMPCTNSGIGPRRWHPDLWVGHERQLWRRIVGHMGPAPTPHVLKKHMAAEGSSLAPSYRPQSHRHLEPHCHVGANVDAEVELVVSARFAWSV